MEKSHFHTLVVLQVKIIYCLLAALGLVIIAVLDLYEGQPRFAAIAAAFALGLGLYAGYLLLRRRKRSSPYPEWLLVGGLLIFTLFGMHQNAQVAHWMYFVPVYTYFLVPFRLANVVLVLYSLALITLVLNQFSHDGRLQMLLTYAASFTFSLMYALINERDNRRMAEIINTDPLTQVYNEHQLLIDLNKEITRADRQRTGLVLLGVAVPPPWRSLKIDEYEQRLSLLGHKLRKALRRFDTCYRLNNDDFVIVMPHSTLADAAQLQASLAEALAADGDELRMVPQLYRADDDMRRLISRVQEGLHAH